MHSNQPQIQTKKKQKERNGKTYRVVGQISIAVIAVVPVAKRLGFFKNRKQIRVKNETRMRKNEARKELY